MHYILICTRQLYAPALSVYILKPTLTHVYVKDKQFTCVSLCLFWCRPAWHSLRVSVVFQWRSWSGVSHFIKCCLVLPRGQPLSHPCSWCHHAKAAPTPFPSSSHAFQVGSLAWSAIMRINLHLKHLTLLLLRLFPSPNQCESRGRG